ncbi:MAG: UDP-forming cellulose synthase catalytic subunit [Pseudochelatococcus sp.]|jgi:cellulose synthase (UDP-forming)|uniref:UDP-forming cellulose synthase catalytic subunit n=1 Tax=Pseudochelatococcus sp. TaxID=2020869 RepID=UPI003D8ECE68
MKKIGAGMFWGLLSLVVIGLLSLPVSLQAHLMFSCAVIVAMALLKLARVQGAWRQVMLALGSCVILRYAYWRTTSTLPPTSEIENFIPAILLYGAEMYGIVMLGLSLFVVAAPPRPRTSPRFARDDLPTVDVFVPSYNEDAAMLATTLAAAKSMDYPADRLTVWLLDDGGTDEKCNAEDAVIALAAQQRRAELSQLCEDLGVRYLARAANEHAKAGNLNNALAHASGELIAVFDADHAPARTFLSETVGFFKDDSRLFLVQTPHFFINPDPIEYNLDTFEKMPSENEMFNGIVMRSLDKWNAVFFCGSAAVLRRAALDEIGGFRHRSITEDCETALSLHARGWSSAYVDKPLIAGLQPETYANFIGQRSRWAQGMTQIMLFDCPPLKRGLTFPQRLCYLSSALHWFFPLSRLVFLLAPLLYIFFSLKIFVISESEFLAYVVTYMTVNLLMQNYLYGFCRWPWISELYEYLQSVYLLPAVISALINPRKPSFRVTAKNEVRAESRISDIGLPLFFIFGILAVALAVTIVRIVLWPGTAGLMVLIGGWNVVNLIIAGCALGVVSERRNRRSTHRVDIMRRCDLTTAGGETFAGTIEDVSIGGAGIRLVNARAESLPRDSHASITFRTSSGEIGAPLPVIVRKTTANGVVRIGCQFAATRAIHHILIADLAFASADQWEKFQKSRRANVGILRGSLWFLRTALRQTARGLRFLFARGRSGAKVAGAGS